MARWMRVVVGCVAAVVAGAVVYFAGALLGVLSVPCLLLSVVFATMEIPRSVDRLCGEGARRRLLLESRIFAACMALLGSLMATYPLIPGKLAAVLLPAAALAVLVSLAALLSTSISLWRATRMVRKRGSGGSVG